MNRRRILQIIASQTNSGTTLFTGTGLSTRDSPIPLVGGRKYYLEVLHQTDTAVSSFFQVGWQRPDGVQEIIPTLHLAQYPYDAYSGADYTAPVLNADGFNGGDLPPSAATNEGRGAPFAVRRDCGAAHDVPVAQQQRARARSQPVLFGIRAGPLQPKQRGLSICGDQRLWGPDQLAVVLSITPDTTPPVVTRVPPRATPTRCWSASPNRWIRSPPRPWPTMCCNCKALPAW